MKQLKTQRKYITQMLRDNKAMMRYCTKDKNIELTEQNKVLQIRLDELKLMKRFYPTQTNSQKNPT